MVDENTTELLSLLYHTFRAKRRLHVIRILKASEESVISVRQLAREIAAAEHGLPLSHATGEPYRNAYNALSQTHLATLSAAKVIIYDPKRQTVSPGPNFEIAALLLEINTPTVALFSTDAEDVETFFEG